MTYTTLQELYTDISKAAKSDRAKGGGRVYQKDFRDINKLTAWASELADLGWELDIPKGFTSLKTIQDELIEFIEAYSFYSVDEIADFVSDIQLEQPGISASRLVRKAIKSYNQTAKTRDDIANRDWSDTRIRGAVEAYVRHVYFPYDAIMDRVVEGLKHDASQYLSKLVHNELKAMYPDLMGAIANWKNQRL